MRERRTRWLMLGSAWLALLGAPAMGGAAPVPCPVDEGISQCALSEGAAQLLVLATSNDGGTALLSMGIGSVTDLRFEGFKIYSFADGGFFIDTALDSATVDAATGTIRVQFTDEDGAVTAVGLLRLSYLEQGSLGFAVLEETITLESNVSETVSGRLYVLTDFDLNGSPIDAAASATQGGARIEQGDDGPTGIIEVTGAAPDGFEVAPCCALLDNIAADVFRELDGTASVTGPANLTSALSWDRAIAPFASVTFTLRKTIAVDVPEPAGGAATATALLALGLLGARRRGSSTPS